MKKGRVGNIFAFLALTILISSPFVFAGLGDWFSGITGKATTNATALQVTVGNTAPTVYFVNNSYPTITLSEGGAITFQIRFNASDSDGVANLNDASASVNVTRSGSTRSNTSCVHVQDFSANNATYECTIRLYYFDHGGAWVINASIYDVNGGNGQNTSASFTVGELHAWQLGSSNALNWSGSLSTSDVNQGSSNDPFVLNNTGNDANLSINVTAYNLLGVTSPSYWINASDIRVSPTIGGCSDGTLASNQTESIITGAELDNANTVATEDIYFCIISLPSTLTAQNYSTSGYGNWVIETQT